mmetsp:Transcript_27036/g.87423  ORF Transcript_27036/g.87423 Transcript_27036/m.87423 type:complete len:201 (-) Transcript_27036:24-626(-)
MPSTTGASPPSDSTSTSRRPPPSSKTSPSKRTPSPARASPTAGTPTSPPSPPGPTSSSRPTPPSSPPRPSRASPTPPSPTSPSSHEAGPTPTKSPPSKTPHRAPRPDRLLIQSRRRFCASLHRHPPLSLSPPLLPPRPLSSSTRLESARLGSARGRHHCLDAWRGGSSWFVAVPVVPLVVLIVPYVVESQRRLSTFYPEP